MMIKYIVFLSAFFVLHSCTPTYNGPCDYEILESVNAFTNGPFDESSIINSVSWNGNCLDISISYGGGCEDHEINVITDGSIIKTDPPIIQLVLQHDNSDACEAIVTETISYDLGENVFLQEEDLIVLSFINPEFSYTLDK